MLTHASEKFIIYDDFLPIEEAKATAENLPNLQTHLNLKERDSANHLISEGDKGIEIAEVIYLSLAAISPALKDAMAWTSQALDSATGLTVGLYTDANIDSFINNFTGDPDAITSYIYYPLVDINAKWQGEIRINSEIIEGCGDFISPCPNRFILIKPGIKFHYTPDRTEGFESNVLIMGSILG